MAEDAIIFARGSHIVIENTDLEARVYSTTGTLLYSGDSREIEMAPGIYIVRAGRTVERVLVK